MDINSILIALIAINILTFFLYRHDKNCAKRGRRRVPEFLLLGIALAGGSPAAYFAMRAFRHKIRKTGFRVRYWLVVAIQLCGLALWLAHATLAL